MNHYVTIISFSSRRQGNCEQICEYLSGCFNSVKLYRFSEFQIQPCGACRYECFQRDSVCPYNGDMEQELLEAVCHSQQVYFVLPNYRGYPCANFYIFQERMQGYFHSNSAQQKAFRRIPKRFVIISNTNADQIREIAAQYSAAEDDILVLKSRAYGLSAIRDKIIDSGDIRKLLREFACCGPERPV